MYGNTGETVLTKTNLHKNLQKHKLPRKKIKVTRTCLLWNVSIAISIVSLWMTTQIPFSGLFFPLWWVEWAFLSPSSIELLVLFWRLFGNRKLEHYLFCLDILHYSGRNDLDNSVTDLGVNCSSYIAQLLIRLMPQIKADFCLTQFYPLSFSCLLQATLSDHLCKMGHICSPMWKSASVLYIGTCVCTQLKKADMNLKSHSRKGQGLILPSKILPSFFGKELL